jgi:tetratricopeptide (TPR) repeat protein
MSQSIIECKQCGGQLEFDEGKMVATCKFCGSINTIPKSVETKSNLFNRANYYRRINEFDKAIKIYEEILKEDLTEAEAHWGIALCKYGIEYVEDPNSGKRIPTCHRTQFDSILIDDNYKEALKYSRYDTKAVYENEAKIIDKIQKEIIAISRIEENFDIFICYKENDKDGKRTQDSVIAQELYYELQKRGYKTFFSRKTLEGKLGKAYEPIIFAALNSSKAMVVLGTKAEHFNAVWVRNEWSRFRERIKKGENKTLIPAYKDMSPYDLPQEFSNLQALDMSKLGFMQDLCDGLERIIKNSSESFNAITTQSSVRAIEPLLKRAFLFLEDGDFKTADTYFERVLDNDPENSSAYMGKLLASLKINKEEELKDHNTPLTTYKDFNKAVRFSNGNEKKRYLDYNQSISNRVEQERIERDKRLEQERIEREHKEEQERILKEEQERILKEEERIERIKREKEDSKTVLISFLIILGVTAIGIALGIFIQR